jgi:hypothetical protein
MVGSRPFRGAASQVFLFRHPENTGGGGGFWRFVPLCGVTFLTTCSTNQFLHECLVAAHRRRQDNVYQRPRGTGGCRGSGRSTEARRLVSQKKKGGDSHGISEDRRRLQHQENSRESFRNAEKKSTSFESSAEFRGWFLIPRNQNLEPTPPWNALCASCCFRNEVWGMGYAFFSSRVRYVQRCRRADTNLVRRLYIHPPIEHWQ